MKINDINFPEWINVKSFSDPSALSCAFADEVASLLTTASATLHASSKVEHPCMLAVSGGKTPVLFFQHLSQHSLDWPNIVITLVDDRCLVESDPDSNAGLLRQHLLQNQASQAQFIPMYDAQATSAVDAYSAQYIEAKALPVVAILGMGTDGHTASLFPCSAEWPELKDSAAVCALTHPTSAPYARITLTPKSLLSFEQRFLHIQGENKLEILKQAVEQADVTQTPISVFLQQPLTIYWCP